MSCWTSKNWKEGGMLWFQRDSLTMNLMSSLATSAASHPFASSLRLSPADRSNVNPFSHRAYLTFPMAKVHCPASDVAVVGTNVRMVEYLREDGRRSVVLCRIQMLADGRVSKGFVRFALVNYKKGTHSALSRSLSYPFRPYPIVFPTLVGEKEFLNRAHVRWRM
ncbi:hypothetical protein BT69DRAFT_1306308 [Atractiella rhizophila]|nr:hypothetical protein BT69DRAFT_1306308 [Atractiella rhizophila]